MFQQEQTKRMKTIISQVTNAISNGEMASAICGNDTAKRVILANMETNTGDTVTLAERMVYGANICIHPSYMMDADVELNELLCVFAKNVDIIIREIIKIYGMDVKPYVIESYCQNLKLTMEA